MKSKRTIRLASAIVIFGAALAWPQRATAGDGGAGCQSGGVGSVSCSVSRCSVTCEQGYYSCCNNNAEPPCRCIAY